MTTTWEQRMSDTLIENPILNSRENKLFFCQIEALETLSYLTEAAKKFGDNWTDNWPRDANESSNPGLNRIATKMATGSGKTAVRAMRVAWHALNKIADREPIGQQQNQIRSENSTAPSWNPSPPLVSCISSVCLRTERRRANG